MQTKSDNQSRLRIGTPYLENWDHPLAVQSGPICPTKWFQLPKCPNFFGQLEPFCWKIGTTLSDNYNHLVIQIKTLAGATSSCLGEKNNSSQESKIKNQESSVKSQESIVKSQGSRVNSQVSRVNSQQSTVNSQQSTVDR